MLDQALSIAEQKSRVAAGTPTMRKAINTKFLFGFRIVYGLI